MSKVTLILDAMGSLHAFEGNHFPRRVTSCIYTVNGKEAELFIQNDWEVESALESLTEDEKEHLKRGYVLVTDNFCTEYFPE